MNYNKSLSENRDYSGIKELCVFNQIPRFHVTNNPAVDVMHDFLEGFGRYDLALLLHYFIYVSKYFKLEHLNCKIQAFHYGPKNSTNKPPEILESHLKKKCIMLSSAEMLNLVENFNLIIGLCVDENDKHWQLLLSLKDILNTLRSTKITIDTPNILELKITEYLMTLNELFSNKMKPKHHFAVHYASVMKKVGPLWNICCRRFESKHRGQTNFSVDHLSSKRLQNNSS